MFIIINKVSDDACQWNGHEYRMYVRDKARERMYMD